MARLGITYNVFEGCEFLRPSLRQVRPVADYINVVYQRESYFGVPIDDKDLTRIRNCDDLYDNAILYEPDQIAEEYTSDEISKAKSCERQKRQLGLDDALKNGVDYWMNMDVDEFFKTDELERAAEKIVNSEITHAGCKIQPYINLPIFQAAMLERGGSGIMKMPLFTLVDNDSYMMDGEGPFKTDPTRMVNSPNISTHHHVFDESEIVMHHMKKVREDLRKKYENTSRSTKSFDRDNMKEKIERIKDFHPEKEDRHGFIVDNFFNIDLDLFK